MSEIKIVSDSTKSYGYRFITEIIDGAQVGVPRNFRTVLVGKELKSSLVIAGSDSATGALGEIQQLIDLLKEAQTAIERFRGGVKRELEPLPEAGVMPKIGGQRFALNSVPEGGGAAF